MLQQKPLHIDLKFNWQYDKGEKTNGSVPLNTNNANSFESMMIIELYCGCKQHNLIVHYLFIRKYHVL
jgi:hypothetical protein